MEKKQNIIHDFSRIRIIWFGQRSDNKDDEYLGKNTDWATVEFGNDQRHERLAINSTNLVEDDISVS
jgi:hypothetical protein